MKFKYQLKFNINLDDKMYFHVGKHFLKLNKVDTYKFVEEGIFPNSYHFRLTTRKYIKININLTTR
jgi:hypothetical protein